MNKDIAALFERKFFIRDIETLFEFVKQSRKTLTTNLSLEELLLATVKYAEITGKPIGHLLEDYKKRNGVFVVIQSSGAFDFVDSPVDCLGFAYLDEKGELVVKHERVWDEGYNAEEV